MTLKIYGMCVLDRKPSQNDTLQNSHTFELVEFLHGTEQLQHWPNPAAWEAAPNVQ